LWWWLSPPQGPSEAVHYHGADALEVAGGRLWPGAEGGLHRQPCHRRLLQLRGWREEVEGPEEPRGGACGFIILLASPPQMGLTTGQ